MVPELHHFQHDISRTHEFGVFLFARTFFRLASVVKLGSVMQIWLVAADCMLLGLQPVLIHLSKAGPTFSYHPLSVNVLTEAMKTALAAALLLTAVCLFLACSMTQFHIASML